MVLRVRDVTEDGRAKLGPVARAKTAPARLVERARLVRLARAGPTAPTLAARLGVGQATVRHGIKRFNGAGLAGLGDAPRSGRPPPYAEGEQGRVIAKARGLPPKPADGDVPPPCHWTLDRPQGELKKEGVPIKRGRIRRLLKAEHITWQKPRAWRESDAPAFAENRGPASGATPRLPLTVP